MKAGSRGSGHDRTDQLLALWSISRLPCRFDPGGIIESRRLEIDERHIGSCVPDRRNGAFTGKSRDHFFNVFEERDQRKQMRRGRAVNLVPDKPTVFEQNQRGDAWLVVPEFVDEAIDR